VRRSLSNDQVDPLLADARAHGASPARLEQLRGAIEHSLGLRATFGVWAAHWHAFAVFRGMATQWRTRQADVGLVYEGLDYGALQPVLEEHAELPAPLRQRMPRLMPQLRLLEMAARDALNGGDERDEGDDAAAAPPGRTGGAAPRRPAVILPAVQSS
jgi:hypothetical protein